MLDSRIAPPVDPDPTAPGRVDLAVGIAARQVETQGCASASCKLSAAPRGRLYEHATQTLELTGSERDAARLWFELGDVLRSLGDLAASNAAYRRSATLAGIDWIVPALRERVTSKA